VTTDTSEKSLDAPIIRHMTGTDGLGVPRSRVAEVPAVYCGNRLYRRQLEKLRPRPGN